MEFIKTFFDRLFKAADNYLKQSKWTDMALLKFCLCSIGILIGLNIPQKKRKGVQTCAAFVFIATYLPLMGKFLPILMDEMIQTDDTSDSQ